MLQEAMDKITFELMDSLPNGETLKLNERFSLYKYLDEDIFILGDNEDEFEYSVMYDESNDNSIVFEEF